MLGDIFTIIAPVILCAGIGFIWAKKGVPYATRFVTTLVTNIGFPCMIFAALVKADLDPRMLGTMGLAAVVTLAGFVVVAVPLLRLMGAELRAFLPAMMFANTGNMGLPLCLLAFGREGLALGVAYFAVNSVFVFGLGPAIAAGSAKPGELLKIPLLWSALAALAVKLGGVPIPAWMMNTLDLVGAIPIPLMLITLGVALAGLKVSSFGRSLVLSLMRLAIGFGVGWGAAVLLGLEGAARGVVIIECAMPVAVFNFLFATLYDHRPAEVAGTVLISTLISFALLPALMWFVLGGVN